MKYARIIIAAVLLCVAGFLAVRMLQTGFELSTLLSILALLVVIPALLSHQRN